MGVKSVIKQHWARMHDEPEKYKWFFVLYSRTVGRNKVRGLKGNKLDICCAKLDRNQFYFHGTGNEVVIEPGAQVWDCTFQIMGNNNKIVIGKDMFLICAELWMSKDSNVIDLGAESTLQGKPQYPIHMAAIEGTSIEVGKECMISAAVEIRTADGHSIVDMNGKRINPSQSIKIGDHVWMGTGVVVTKGIEIIDHCIVGTKSVVTRPITQRFSVSVGNPAKVVKENIDWRKELLEVE